MEEIQKLQKWYLAHCDGDWEHTFGVKIDTLDNPGWSIEIDLRDTELAESSFSPLSRGDAEVDSDWIHCKVENEKFLGAGGAMNLAELLQSFLTWAAIAA